MESIEKVSLEQFIKLRYIELLEKNGGIILLKNINRNTKKHIYEIANEYVDMAAFCIKEPYTDEEHMVLRYKSPIFTTPNFMELFIAGNKAYINGDYKECIEIYKEALLYGKSNNKIFVILGFAYLKLGEYKDALDYLTVANCLSVDSKKNIHFTETISLLQNILNDDPIATLTNKIIDNIESDTIIKLLRDSYFKTLIQDERVILNNLGKEDVQKIKKLISSFPAMNYQSEIIDEREIIILEESIPLHLPIELKEKKAKKKKKTIECSLL